MNKSITVIIFSLIPFVCFAQNQNEDYFADDFVRYQDWIYKKNIHTVQLRENSYEMAAPLINLNSDQQLKLSFDDFDGGVKNYMYSLIHCDANWKPSDIPIPDYINGFFEDNISNYEFSLNTLQKFTHYTLVFPSSSMKLTKSGNYIIKVFEDGNKDVPVLTKRFMVAENLVSVIGNVHQAAGADDYFNKQEVDFSVVFSGYKITNPFADLKIVITQNNRWDNALYGLKPIFTKENELTFDYDDGSNCFNGGNEFRNFDTKSLRFLSPNLKSIVRDSIGGFNIELQQEEIKTFKRYYQNPDLNGEFIIRVQEGSDERTEAEYCKVNFFFPYEQAVNDGNFYVLGKFCDWKIGKENMLQYNAKKRGYETTLFLKQGFYNYMYVFSEDGKFSGDETLIEGNHWETENDYTIYVYHRRQGTYYDQLISVRKLNSIRK